MPRNCPLDGRLGVAVELFGKEANSLVFGNGVHNFILTGHHAVQRGIPLNKFARQQMPGDCLRSRVLLKLDVVDNMRSTKAFVNTGSKPARNRVGFGHGFCKKI